MNLIKGSQAIVNLDLVMCINLDGARLEFVFNDKQKSVMKFGCKRQAREYLNSIYQEFYNGKEVRR